MGKLGPKETIESLDDSMKLIGMNPEYFIKYVDDYSIERFLYFVAETCNVYTIDSPINYYCWIFYIKLFLFKERIVIGLY